MFSGIFGANFRKLSVFSALSIVLFLCSFLPAFSEEYVIQPDDVLAIRVGGEEPLSKSYIVDGEGFVFVDTVGKIKAAGQTVPQFKSQLSSELMKYLKLFDLSVTVVGDTGGRILVYGEVGKPGVVRLRLGSSLLDALAQAGQTTSRADSKRVAIFFKKSGATQTVDLDTVLRDPTLNVALSDGDTIIVPNKESLEIRIDGAVQKPGSFALETVRTAYAAVMAAGPNDAADWKRIVLRRKNSNLPLTVDLSRVRTGLIRDDLELSEGDTLTVMSKFSGTVTLRGEVKNPGEHDLQGEKQILDFVLSTGGGFTPRADRIRVQLMRPSTDNAGQKTVKIVDLLAVEEGRRRSDDPALTLEPGDILFVPTAMATLRGEVKKQGQHPLGSTTNLWDFVMQTGEGLTEKADASNVQVIRDGQVIKTVDLSAISLGGKPANDTELQLEPGDVVFVPNDEQRRFVIVGGVGKPGSYPAKPGMTLLDAIAAAGSFNDRATRKSFVVAPAERLDESGNLTAPSPSIKERLAKGKNVDPTELGLVVIDYKKLIKGDPSQNIPIGPRDRILIPEEVRQNDRMRRPTLIESAARLLPFASLFMGGYGYGYGRLGYW